MIYFIIALALSIAIYLIFKYAGNKGIDVFSVILINYPVCVGIGIMHLFFKEEHVHISKTIGIWAVILGGLFIGSFVLMAKLTQQRGVGVSSVVSRVSLVIPVLFFHFYANEPLPIWALVGIVLAIVSVFLISDTGQGSVKINGFLPILVFISYGAVDIGLKLSQNSIAHLASAQHELTVGIFIMAGIYGLSLKKIQQLKISTNAISLGFILAFVNYYSIYFFLLALEFSAIPSTIIFPLNGTIILLGANVASIILFKESLKPRKLLAILVAILAIVLLNIKDD